MEDYQPPDIAPDAMVSARIDIKKFAQFLYSSQINAQNVVCSMFCAWYIIVYVVRVRIARLLLFRHGCLAADAVY
jgi:hypothetical protein